MLFSEPSFLFFFLPVVLLLHTVAGDRARNGLLLAASVFFYAWGEPVHVAILALSIAVNTVVGRWIVAARRSGGAGVPLAVGVSANLLLLGHFKYAGFLSDTLGIAYAAPALPIGISFFTFQAISYLVDVERGDAEPPRRLLDVGLYIAMFPQLIAGPIVRWADVGPQLAQRTVSLEDFASGVRRFSCGLAKKMLLANTVALPADRIFALPPEHLDAPLAWAGALAYALQIYFDFSGYSDMAIGLGRMFGLHYRENFEYPYVSRSIREFWRRWHISLSSWFRDYLYIPLGGGRGGTARVAFNLWTVFLLCGLWHGASWNFVVWGAYHGFFLALERVTGFAEKLPRALGWTYAGLVVTGGWIFFRAETLPQALAFLGSMAGLAPESALGIGAVADPRFAWALGIGLVAATPWPRQLFWRLRGRALAAPGWRRPCWGAFEVASLALALVACMASVAADAYNPFIYFRF